MRREIEVINESLVKVHYTRTSLKWTPSWSFPWVKHVITESRSTRVAEQIEEPFFNWADTGEQLSDASYSDTFYAILAGVARFKYMTSGRALVQTTSDI